MLEFYTQLSSYETLDGQANDHSKKKFLKENQEIFLLQVCIVFFFGSNLIFFTWLTCETIALKILFHKLKAKRMSCLIS